MKRSIVEAGQGGPGSAVARQEASLDSHAPLLLPRHVERKLEERASALKRPGLSSRLARAEALRTSVLEERSKRARSLSFDNVERARQRRTRAKIKQCFEEAARTARELLASKRRTSELRGLRERVATKNARVDSVRDAMRARSTKERTVRVLALESRLELAAQRRRALSRSPRGAGASQGPLPAFGPSPDAVPLPDPLDPHLAARLIQRRWRRARAERAIRVLASHLPRWFVRRARQAARGRGNPSLVDPGFEVVEGVEVDRDYLLFRAFDRSSQVVQNPAVIRAARGLLDKLPGGEPGGGRYARPLLASFVIVLHPEVVMSRKGNAVEDLLRERAAALVACLAHLIQASGGDFGSFRQKLSSYAAAFVSWKKGDAAALEGDLIKMACDLTASVLCKCGPDLGAEHVVSNPDLSAMVEALRNDRRLLAMKLRSLTGLEGVQRMERAVKARVVEFEEAHRLAKEEEGELEGRVEEAIRAAMADIVQERVDSGDHGHTLNLWAEVRDRLMRLSGRRPCERQRTSQCVDCEYARELVESGAMDNSILGDMIEQASQRIGELGAEAYEEETLTWGRRMAQRMRESESAGEVLSNFFNDADVLLTRMEAGVAASLLSQALASGLGGEE
ncbi:hypothetical protein HKI87_05g35930 [Chloropicon roscoffensis]|uniref:Uncharacterized protein n=1 Tax=Chloropicon roscoffensis TaxID=1461544 RepID=A0AAX4P7Q8_9CHLO